MRAARVIGQAKDTDGNVKGRYDTNPILNTRVYDVIFPDGSVQAYGANIIAENLYSQVDEDGHRYQLLEMIVDRHTTNGHAVDKEDEYAATKSGQRRQRQMMIGWEFLIQWKDGTESWCTLKELKESFLIEVAEYAKA